MLRKLLTAVLVGIGATTMLATNSMAGEWGAACSCGYSHTFYAPPTYSYAPPIYTIYPHYVVQPNFAVRRTYLIPQTYYREEAPPYLPGLEDDYYSPRYAPDYGVRYAPRYGRVHRAIKVGFQGHRSSHRHHNIGIH